MDTTIEKFFDFSRVNSEINVDLIQFAFPNFDESQILFLGKKQGEYLCFIFWEIDINKILNEAVGMDWFKLEIEHNGEDLTIVADIGWIQLY